jgi:hypothetical protein
VCIIISPSTIIANHLSTDLGVLAEVEVGR